MNNRNLFYFGAGLGLAAGYFLNSEKGKEVRNQTASYLSEKANTLKTKSNTAVESATTMMSQLKEKGNEYLQSLKSEAVTSKDVDAFIETKVAEFKNSLLDEVRKFGSDQVKERRA